MHKRQIIPLVTATYHLRFTNKRPRALSIRSYAHVTYHRLRLGVTLKSVTLGNVTMSHRTRERPAECLASLSTQL
ncbi:hypothetical protein EVAR_53290_1 [Eumeta japonica]|uniref:Uncharacterized protein n=1 Tax=Eumeta variegata TaxID=151549 RepID=A0A4C1Z0R3_EUMVA|nr:hypothetical protein EVAR_53290_1 [Eumeta japonica]